MRSGLPACALGSPTKHVSQAIAAAPSPVTLRMRRGGPEPWELSKDGSGLSVDDMMREAGQQYGRLMDEEQEEALRSAFAALKDEERRAAADAAAAGGFESDSLKSISRLTYDLRAFVQGAGVPGRSVPAPRSLRPGQTAAHKKAVGWRAWVGRRRPHSLRVCTSDQCGLSAVLSTPGARDALERVQTAIVNRYPPTPHPHPRLPHTSITTCTLFGLPPQTNPPTTTTTTLPSPPPHPPPAPPPAPARCSTPSWRCRPPSTCCAAPRLTPGACSTLGAPCCSSAG